MWIDLAELSNTKNEPPDPETGWIHTTVADPRNGQIYRVRVVGRPDLRRIKRYYFGVVNDVFDTIDGYFYLNDVMLRGVKRELGASAIVHGPALEDDSCAGCHDPHYMRLPTADKARAAICLDCHDEPLEASILGASP